MTDEPEHPGPDDADEPEAAVDADATDDAGAAHEVTVTPLGDELDLHTFQPRDCADVVEEYVRAAAEAGLTSVRIIHGKGTGTLRRIVHSVLERHPDVASFTLAGERAGSWGATLVELVRR
ncbi:MAG: Smr/MutS family protein [Myxococcales bacterium]|nr:Smr/MutS family protein [Myxococcales bacterium]